MSHRLACLLVPLFPLAARLRSEPDLGTEALALFEGDGGSARVVAATRRARKAGIRPGMSLSQARALMPKLLTRARDQACERAAQQNLLEVAERFSPRLEDAGPGVVYLDLSGLERHFPGGSPERDLGHALLRTAEGGGLPLRVGVASSKLAARVAAELPDSPTLVADGEEAAFLAPLPLSRLSPEADVVETLRRWGIRSVGDFARLPKNEVASRLGPGGQRLHEKARGLDSRPLVPYQPPPFFDEGLDLEWPLVALEPFLFVARAALERLCRRMEERGLACSRLEVRLRLEPDGEHHRLLRLPAPTLEVKTLLTLIRLDLENRPPGAAVIGFTLIGHPDRPRAAQLSLFGPPSLPPDRLATTLARIFALLGPGRAGAPRTVDGHRPERAALVDYDPPPPPKLSRESRSGRGLLIARVLRPPVPLEVITTADPGAAADDRSPPRSIRTPPREGTDRRQRLDGEVKVASGPWSLEEEWWSERPVDREYWDVELSNGGLYRLYRRRRTGEWFADGIYD